MGYITGAFAAGGERGKAHTIDLRMRSGCVASPFDRLVRTVLSLALKAAPGPVLFQQMVPLTMKKRQECREKSRE